MAPVLARFERFIWLSSQITPHCHASRRSVPGSIDPPRTRASLRRGVPGVAVPEGCERGRPGLERVHFGERRPLEPQLPPEEHRVLRPKVHTLPSPELEADAHRPARAELQAVPRPAGIVGWTAPARRRELHGLPPKGDGPGRVIRTSSGAHSQANSVLPTFDTPPSGFSGSRPRSGARALGVCRCLGVPYTVSCLETCRPPGLTTQEPQTGRRPDCCLEDAELPSADTHRRLAPPQSGAVSSALFFLRRVRGENRTVPAKGVLRAVRGGAPKGCGEGARRRGPGRPRAPEGRRRECDHRRATSSVLPPAKGCSPETIS